MECKMCPRNSMKRQVGLMDYKLFEKIVDQIPLHANNILCIHGIGDSLLHPELKEFITYANQKGFKTTTSTNPSSLNPRTIKNILESGLCHLTISLDGVDSATYQYLRGKAADYEKAIKNIHEFLHEKKKGGYARPKVEMSIIKMDKTQMVLDEFKRMWDTEGIDHIAIKGFTTWDGSVEDILKLNQQRGTTSSGKSQGPCIRPWLTISVLWDGRVVPCCYDFDGKFVLGDLNSQTIAEVWNGAEARRLRKSLIDNDFSLNPLCEPCMEWEGFAPSKVYPLNIIGVMKSIGLGRISHFIKKEGNVYLGD
jgi:hypothetical protein